MDSDRTALEQNLIATLAENGCSEKQSMLILEETLKHIDDYNSNRAENLVSQAASQAMPEPNVSCENCKQLDWHKDNFSTDEEDAICKRHKRKLDDMFPDKNLDLFELGCKQFEQK